MRADAPDAHTGNNNDVVKRYTGANGETIFWVKASNTAVIDLCNSPVSYWWPRASCCCSREIILWATATALLWQNQCRCIHLYRTLSTTRNYWSSYWSIPSEEAVVFCPECILWATVCNVNNYVIKYSNLTAAGKACKDSDYAIVISVVHWLKHVIIYLSGGVLSTFVFPLIAIACRLQFWCYSVCERERG